MDTKTIIVTLVCAVLGSSALTAVVNAVVGAIQKKRGKAKKWNGSAYYWWERSPIVRTYNRFCLVSTNGGVDYDDASYARGVAFGFCF